jgi:hypothetical protein
MRYPVKGEMMNDCFRYSAAISMALLFFTPGNVFGNEYAQKEKEKLSIGPALVFGVGFKNIKVGATSNGSDVTISGGGGFGYGIAADYRLSDITQLGITLMAQKAALTPLVTNAEGEFSRTPVLLTVKRKVADFSGKSRLKAGAGIGLYNAGVLKLASDELHWDDKIYYDAATGFHLTFDYERFYGESSSWTIGVGLSSVSYNANKYKIRSLELPLSFLNPDYKTLDGGGADIYFTLQF